MNRRWIKGLPPKIANELIPDFYKGSWNPHMDRYWESTDGYSVSSRQIKTDWGVVEHVTIHRMAHGGDIPWSVKQEIKDELFGFNRTAIEVYPTKKNLVDVCDVYHLWVLPKDFTLPFGIHPTRDPQGKPVERGYDFDTEKLTEWTNSPERAALMEGNNAFENIEG